MQFTDFVFLFLLLPVGCVLFYRVAPRFGTSVGLILLLCVSLLFYSTWGNRYFALLVGSISANFAAACIILVAPDNRRTLRQTTLYLGQAYNFGTLIWFKYRFVAHIFSTSTQSFTLLDAAIPVGISFYTFQQAILLVDAYHRDASVVGYMGDLRTLFGKITGYFRHAFFVSFFPHLLIGPIVYLSEFQPQVASPNFGRAKRVNLEVGVALVIVGLFKKIVIADHLAQIANSVYVNPDAALFYAPHISTATAWVASLAYCAQLYFDFSGYSDMALGSARMLGIRFPMNFYSPWRATGIVDYYRRWNITLTRVIARFVYTPLSMNAARLAIKLRWSRAAFNVASVWVPLLINFEVIALWHGARLTFVLFGVIHGVWYVAETAVYSTRAFKKWRNMTSERYRALGGRIIFLAIMPLTFVLFRSTTLTSFTDILDLMFHFESGLPPLRDCVILAGAIAIIVMLPNSMQLFEYYRPGVVTYPITDDTPSRMRFRWRPDLTWTVIMSAMLLSGLYYLAQQPPFLYMGF
jgi:alginate O-acetyltransferase complex protein AlgI